MVICAAYRVTITKQSERNAWASLTARWAMASRHSSCSSAAAIARPVQLERKPVAKFDREAVAGLLRLGYCGVDRAWMKA